MGRKAYFLELMMGEQSCDAVGMLRNEFLSVCAKYCNGSGPGKVPREQGKAIAEASEKASTRVYFAVL
jgi:hypothetical protein